MDSDISHASDCVFYDIELRELKKLFKDMNTVFSRINKRAERRQTIQISKSLFDYVERKNNLIKCPQDFYNFSYSDCRIFIFRYRGAYSVYCTGFDYPLLNIRSEKSFFGVGHMYGYFTDLSECIFEFKTCCNWFISNVLEKKEDIPF